MPRQGGTSINTLLHIMGFFQFLLPKLILGLELYNRRHPRCCVLGTCTQDHVAGKQISLHSLGNVIFTTLNDYTMEIPPISNSYQIF